MNELSEKLSKFIEADKEREKMVSKEIVDSDSINEKIINLEEIHNKSKDTSDEEDDDYIVKASKNAFDTVEKDLHELYDGMGFDESFDINIDSLFELTDDEELLHGLITQGRKYNQAHQENQEESEIAKSFVEQEKAISSLIGDIDKDIISIEKDINNMRLSRVRSPKSLADLISVKGSLHNTKLAAIKEINNVKKAVIDLNMKANKDSGNSDDQASMAASLALQQLITGENIQTPQTADLNPIDTFGMSTTDELRAEAEYEKNLNEGDLYIQYENDGVELYAQADNEGNVHRILARDREGNIVPDYPLPSFDPKGFDIHSDLGTATDNFHRNYRLEEYQE